MTVITPDMINLPSQARKRTTKNFGTADTNTMRFTHPMGDPSLLGQSARSYLMETFGGRPIDGLISSVKATGSRLTSRQRGASAMPGSLVIVLSTKHPLYEDARLVLKDINSRLPQVKYVSEHVKSSTLKNMDLPVTPPALIAPKDLNPYVRLKTKMNLDPRFDEVEGLLVIFSKPMSKDAFIESVLRGLNTDPSVNECPPGMMCAAVMRPVYTQQQVNTARSELQSAVSKEPRGLKITFSGLSPFVTNAVDSLIHSLGHRKELKHVVFTTGKIGDVTIGIPIKISPDNNKTTMPIQIEKDPISNVATDKVESSVASTDGADSDKGMSPWVIGGISVSVLALIYGAYHFGKKRQE